MFFDYWISMPRSTRERDWDTTLNDSVKKISTSMGVVGVGRTAMKKRRLWLFCFVCSNFSLESRLIFNFRFLSLSSSLAQCTLLSLLVVRNVLFGPWSVDLSWAEHKFGVERKSSERRARERKKSKRASGMYHYAPSQRVKIQLSIRVRSMSTRPSRLLTAAEGNEEKFQWFIGSYSSASSGHRCCLLCVCAQKK